MKTGRQRVLRCLEGRHVEVARELANVHTSVECSSELSLPVSYWCSEYRCILKLKKSSFIVFRRERYKLPGIFTESKDINPNLSYHISLIVKNKQLHCARKR